MTLVFYDFKIVIFDIGMLFVYMWRISTMAMRHDPRCMMTFLASPSSLFRGNLDSGFGGFLVSLLFSLWELGRLGYWIWDLGGSGYSFRNLIYRLFGLICIARLEWRRREMEGRNIPGPDSYSSLVCILGWTGIDTVSYSCTGS